MNKNIVLAGVLSLVAIFGTVAIYNTYFAPETVPGEAAGRESQAPADAEPSAAEAATVAFEGSVPFEALPADETAATEILWDTDLFQARFSTRGAVLTSFTLKEYDDIELVLGAEGKDEFPLALKMGGMDAPVLNRVFSVDRDERALRFSAELIDGAGESLLLTKTVTFAPDEYLMKVDISLRGRNPLPVTPGGTAYTLGLGPQIGPAFAELDGRYNFRHFLVSRDGGKANFRVPPEGMILTEPAGPWAGMEGKYFTTFLISPDIPRRLAWDGRPLPGMETRRSVGILRQGGGRSEISDTYYYYLGPKDPAVLGRYDAAQDNAWGLAGAGLTAILGQSKTLLTLSAVMKAVLDALFQVLRNYGLAVILLALLVEAALIPLNKKTVETNARMRLHTDEVAAIKRGCGRDKQKAMKRVGDFYASKGITPRPATRTLLIHLPVFILLYFLFSTHIAFRQVPFIPGLVPDLAKPDSLLSFAPVVMPITNWSDIRLLPLLILGITLFQSRRVQAPVDAFGSMRTMSILMPIMIFIVIYNMPSGAVLYWLTHTIASVGVQMYVNRKVEKGAAVTA